MMDWNKKIKKCKRDLEKAKKAADELTPLLVNYIDEKVKSGLLAPFLGKKIEIKGLEIEALGDDFAYELYEWSANKEGMSKKYFLVLTGDITHHLPSHLKLLGKTEMYEKIVEAVTDKFSGEALKEMVEEFKEKWSKTD